MTASTPGNVPGNIPGNVMVTVRQLAAWTTSAATANDKIQTARQVIETGEGLLPGETVDSVLQDAENLTEQVRSTTRAAAGIHAAPLLVDMPEIDFFQLDTPDTRELLATLEKALAIAERVDAARGRTVGAGMLVQPGESAGTDLAETISAITLRVRGEVHGIGSGHE